MASIDITETELLPNGNAVHSDDGPLSDIDGSSSLSEIEDESEQEEPEFQNTQGSNAEDVDTEAETERIEPSPHTPGRHANALGSTAFEKSPSKLVQALSADNNDNDGDGDDQYSDSAMSSPLASIEDPAENDGDEEPESDVDGSDIDMDVPELLHGKKRKRGESEETPENLDTAEEPLRKRTGSVKDGVGSSSHSDEESGAEEAEAMDASRESTIEPAASPEPEEPAEDVEEEQSEEKSATKRNGPETTRQSRSSKLAQVTAAGEEDADAVEDADEAEAAEEPENASEDDEVAEELDEAEAERKNEAEFAKKQVAADALMELEKQFAILRDKLYDERIGEINRQLLQLNGPEPTNAEYLEKLQHILKYRNDKHDYEHNLLAFKIQSLKQKSVAERSTIHSSYFQSVREIREKYLDFANEQFYKIQRDRFRPDENMANYSIPFPERRSQQIAQQASYNREVSILAGIAKYVGFPAAPEITSARRAEIEEDIEKMGLPPYSVSTSASRPLITNPFQRHVSSAAEEQFLEQTPWANPQHPIHNRTSKQLSEQQSIFATPANQKTTVDVHANSHSASTIPENLSAQASSAVNTPHDHDTHHSSEHQTGHRIVSNGRFNENISSRASLSPTDTRKMSSLSQYRSESKKNQDDGPGPAVHSPPQARNSFHSRPDAIARGSSVQHDALNRHQNSSPLTSMQAPSIAAGSGYSRFSAR